MEPQEEMHSQQDLIRLRLQKSDLENQNEGLQNMISLLEAETETNAKLLAKLERMHKEEDAELDNKVNELQLQIEEQQEIILNLRETNIKKAKDEHISETTETSEEFVKLEAEKCEILEECTELQKAIEGHHAQNISLKNEIIELSTKISELQSKLSVTVEECEESNEKIEALQEENLLMTVELETLKGKVGKHSSEGNSLFAEVADGRQQLKNESKKLKDKIMALQKGQSQTSLEIRKLMKENTKMSEEIELAKEQGSTEELTLQLNACKERIKQLEAAHKVWDEEKAAGTIVLGQDDETGNFYDNLLKEEREKTKQVWEQCEGIMARYIAATEEVAAIKRETMVMESLKLRAEAEIAKLKLQLLKNEEDNHKKDVLKLVVEKCPLKEIQNIRRSRFAAEAVDTSTRKLLAKKEVDKITRMTSSLEM